MPLRTMFWADSARGGKLDRSDKGASMCSAPEGVEVIKAFTLLEVELVCKGWSKWEPGEVNPDEVRVVPVCLFCWNTPALFRHCHR
jgi:hypothetical protein